MILKQLISKGLTCLVPIDKHQITFESLNDLDCNSGALFDYIIRNNWNKKYKIIWLIKNENIETLPKLENVEYIPFSKKRNLREKIKLRRSKYLIWDDVPITKYSNKQISIYLTHGFPAMKSVHGIINVPENCNYFLLRSENLKDHAKYQFGIQEKTEFILSGLPRNDYLYSKNDELKKITTDDFNKVIIWMPTFRKTANSNRNDSTKENKYGIPLISTEKEIDKLNQKLKKDNNLLIIKIHGRQDTNFDKIDNCSNIKLITLFEEKKLNINTYKLLADTDALITDYSSVSFDYLLTNKPIGYIVDDMENYKLGFAFEKPLEYMPGNHIYNFEELLGYLDDVTKNKDKFKAKRQKLLNEINKNDSENNCERIFSMIDGGKL